MPASTLAKHLSRSLALQTGGIPSLVAACRARASIDVAEAAASAHPFVVSTLWRQVGGSVIVWTATADSADRFASDCSFYLDDTGAVVRSLRPRDDNPQALTNPSQRSERLETLAA